MKNKIYKGILGIIASFTIALSLSACSTPSTPSTPNITNVTNTSGISVGTNMSINRNTMANSNMPTPKTRVS